MNRQTQTTVANAQSLDKLVKTIRIPPQPKLLVELQKELNKDEPSSRGLAKIIEQDVALAASLLKLTNSSFFGLRLKAQSVGHAVDLIGYKQTGLLMSGIIARQSLQVKGLSLHSFWDFSSKRANALSEMVRRVPICSADMAHTFGLFCDIGVPILMERFPDYVRTWKNAETLSDQSLTAYEDSLHMTNHSAIGSLLARTWGLPEEISTAILFHHDYAILENTSVDNTIRGLIALTCIAEYAILKNDGAEHSVEWDKSNEYVCHYLGISLEDAEDWCEELSL
jgi:HD-like signal output (HDOD) protein